MRDIIYVKLDIVYSINQQLNETYSINQQLNETITRKFFNSEIESDNFTV